MGAHVGGHGSIVLSDGRIVEAPNFLLDADVLTDILDAGYWSNRTIQDAEMRLIPIVNMDMSTSSYFSVDPNVISQFGGSLTAQIDVSSGYPAVVPTVSGATVTFTQSCVSLVAQSIVGLIVSMDTAASTVAALDTTSSGDGAGGSPDVFAYITFATPVSVAPSRGEQPGVRR